MTLELGMKGRRVDRWVGCAGLVLIVGVSGCAEIEVGAEAIKGVNRAFAPAPQVVQASLAAPALAAQATQSAAADVLAPGPNARIDASMIPAPDDFVARGVAEWDGARTLQGIWVAHPQAASARRVRILNTANDFAVDGALFRRDESAGGPSVIVSSDAAEALGMVPGEPVELSIVAIQRGSAEQIAAAEAAAAESAAQEADSAAEPRENATESQAILPPEPEAPADSAVEPREDSAEEADEQLAAEEPREDVAEESSGETQFRFEPAPEGLDEAAAAEAQQADSQTAPQPVPAPSAQPEPEPQPVAAPEPEPAEEAVEVAAAPPPADTGTGTTGEIADGRPFIQAGIFGVPENVNRLIRRIEEAGLPAEGRPITLNGRELTRVVSGPYTSVEARNDALRRIRALGPSDATPVAR